MKRLEPIEGLRAWLALWVVTDHVLSCSGFNDDGRLFGLVKLVHEGILAVDIFIAISGFVIFFLLDKKSENYRQFICRRFFRLYPLLVILLVVAVPLSLLRAWDLQNGQSYLTASAAQLETSILHSGWQNWAITIPAHLLMLHGLVPDAWLNQGFTGYTWLGPAWSISLEWQFYLVAPLLYWMATSTKTFWRLVVFTLCVVLFRVGHNYTWGDGFLPFHLDFFFIGIASYFAYKRHAEASVTREPLGTFLFAICAAWLLFIISNKVREMIPLGLWLIFFGLLLEPEESVFAKTLLPVFTNPVAKFLGKISYSIYLSHELVLIVMQAVLLKCAPHLGHMAHFGILLAMTTGVTIAVSTVLYGKIEVPGMELGRKWAAKLGPLGKGTAS